MKVTTKGRYGLRALVDLTVCKGEGPIPLAEIAERQKLSLNYLEQVFGLLRKAEIVNSTKGPSGGYVLARDAAEITVKEVLTALEGEFSIVERLQDDEMDAVQNAIQKLVWDSIDEKIDNILSSSTLQELADKHDTSDE